MLLPAWSPSREGGAAGASFLPKAGERRWSCSATHRDSQLLHVGGKRVWGRSGVVLGSYLAGGLFAPV